MKSKVISPDQVLYEVASQQQGYFTTKQAESAGYIRAHHSYHVKAGHWVREMRGIYRLAKFPQDDGDAQLMLWYLWSRNRNETPQGVYSHDTALRIYDLSDLMPSKLHMTVPSHFRKFNEVPKILVLYKASLLKSDIRLIRGFAVTTPVRTIFDLFESNHLGKDILIQAATEAIKKGLIHPKHEDKIKKVIKDE